MSGWLRLRASDLVMKVDALLSSLPKANARLELNFAEERHRYGVGGVGSRGFMSRTKQSPKVPDDK